MTPDEKALLEEVRGCANFKTWDPSATQGRLLLKVLDESDRARIAAEAERDGVRANQKEQYEAHEAAKRLTRDDAKCGLLRTLEMRISGQRLALRDLQGRYDALLRGDTSRVLESFRHEKRESRRAYAGWAAARERIKEIETALSDAQALLAQYGEAALVAERVLAEERAKREAAEAQSALRRAVIAEDDAELGVMRERAKKAEALVAELENTLDTSKWDDAPLPEDAAIDAAHPLKTKRHDLFSEAMRLVGARQSKGGLVELVNWLLARHEEWDKTLTEGTDLYYAERERREVAEARVAELTSALRGVIGWMVGPACSDCDVAFRCQIATHEQDCSALVDINNALAVLGRDSAERVSEGRHAESRARLKARVAEFQACVDELRKLCRCGGTGSYTPTCYQCDDSTDDHECPDDRACVVPACLLARELAAKETG